MAGKSAAKSGKRKKSSGGKSTMLAARKPGKSTGASSSAVAVASKTKAAKPLPATNNHRPRKSSGPFYVVIDRDRLCISTTKPASTDRVESADDFPAAKDKAVDLLIARIEGLEHHLWLIKQACDHHDYESRLAGR